MQVRQKMGREDAQVAMKKFLPLVKRIAYHLMFKLPASVQIDDIIQTGMIGLLDALNRYQDSYGAQFETYAVQRVRGAMLDGLREADWLPRSLRKDMRRIEKNITILEQRYSRPPTETELATTMNITLVEYQKLLREARGYQLIYLEEPSENEGKDFLDRYFVDESADPLNHLMHKNMRQTLARAISNLPEREKIVMALYYQEASNLREIGEILGVSESRVCQLHSQAIARLRTKLKHLDIELPQ